MTPEDEFLAELAALRDRFMGEIDTMMRVIQTSFDGWAAAAPGPAPDALIRQAHTLAGTAGAFGLTDVSQAARQLETALDDGCSPSLAAPELSRLWHAAPTSGFKHFTKN